MVVAVEAPLQHWADLSWVFPIRKPGMKNELAFKITPTNLLQLTGNSGAGPLLAAILISTMLHPSTAVPHCIVVKGEPGDVIVVGVETNE